MESISIKKAAFYNAIAKYGSMAVQLGLTMILSRLILPEAFGVIAITTVLLGFLNLFADMGLGINIIQHPEMAKKDIDSLFSFSIVVGIILAGLTALAAFPLASFYNENIYYSLCPTLSIVSFFQAVNVVPNSILMRDKRFKTIAIRTILCTLISGVVAVVLALMGLGVYALVIQSIVAQLFLFVWNYLLAPLSVATFCFGKVAHLLGSYSLFQVLFNFLNYFTRNLDNIVVGKFFGAAPLAQYNKSYAMYLYPNNLFATVLTGVLHPYIREYKEDMENMFNKYLQIEKVMSVVGVFFMMVFFSCSSEIILIMFGSNWGPAGVYLQCLSICMWAQMVCSVSGSIFLGLERTDQTFKCGIINLILIILSIVIGVVFKSLVVLSLCVGLSYNIIFVITNVILVRHTMHHSLRKFFAYIANDAIFVFGFIAFFYFFPEVSSNLIISLLIKVAICTVVYCAYLWITKQWGILLMLKNMFIKK